MQTSAVGLQRQVLRSLIYVTMRGDCNMRGQGSQSILAGALDFVMSSKFEF